LEAVLQDGDLLARLGAGALLINAGDRLEIGARLVMVEHALRVGVAVALDQHDERMRAHAASMAAGDFLDAPAARLFRLERGAAEEAVAAMLGDELEAAFGGGGTDDRHLALQRLGEGLAILEGEVFPLMGHTLFLPQPL